MSNIWISARQVHVPGPQTQTVTETTKVQASSFSITSFDYSLHANSQSITESSKVQATFSLTSFNYA